MHIKFNLLNLLYKIISYKLMRTRKNSPHGITIFILNLFFTKKNNLSTFHLNLSTIKCIQILK